LGSSLEKWWNGKRGKGDWFGVRPFLEDHGINLTGKWIGTFYGVVGGGLKQRGAFDQRGWRTLPRWA
jgi:carbohydrate-selective porin OprB